MPGEGASIALSVRLALSFRASCCHGASWRSFLGAALMLGETLRSWGAGRHWLFVLDDFFIGVPLVLTAILVARPTVARRCAFSASFAATAGMLYGSFFGKLIDPASTDPGNMPVDLLTCLVGGAFFLSLLGLAGSITASRA
jgi:hypothetical protein